MKHQNHPNHVTAIERLHRAILSNDKIKITKAYDYAISLNWETAPNELFEEYDDLIEQGNDILLK